MESHMMHFLNYYKASGQHLVYKHHMCYHIVQRSRTSGNPRYMWTYNDESENRILGTIAKSAHHGSTFYFALLEKHLGHLC
eukprot:3535998-Pyramimonas_sp.AAC.1